MSTSSETQCLYNDIILKLIWTEVKSLKCNELISLLKSHSDLG
jgi:hypothetical protein